MPDGKKLDCIKMKDGIQARLAEKWKGLSDEEVRQLIRDDLETSDDLLARWWRSVGAHKQECQPAHH